MALDLLLWHLIERAQEKTTLLTASRGQHKKIQRELKRESSEPVIIFKAR